MEEVKNPEELLTATMDLLREKKVTSKAMAEVSKRVIEATHADKADWKLLTKAYSDKGRAWVGGNPLLLDKEEPHKDNVSPIFAKLLAIVSAAEAFNYSDELLQDYFDALENVGIKIEIDHDKFEHADTDNLDSLEEELDSIKSYSATIEQYNDELRDEHAMKAEELNFAPSSDYMKVVNIYRKGVAGKEIDDEVQDILTHNELLDSAVNLVSDYAKQISDQAENGPKA